MISGSLSSRHGASSGYGWREGLQYGGYLQIYWINTHRRPKGGVPPAWAMDEVTTSHRKNWHRQETDTRALAWTDPLVLPKQWKGDMRFGTWNMSILYRSGSLITAAK
jgi:hypothetical protein